MKSIKILTEKTKEIKIPNTLILSTSFGAFIIKIQFSAKAKNGAKKMGAMLSRVYSIS
jgi:hypothetical protein